jgi:hypothetical protein
VKVPDIGDFTDVPVIDVFVKVGDTIKVDDAIVTLESDKATMDVPSSGRRRGQGSEGQTRRSHQRRQRGGAGGNRCRSRGSSTGRPCASTGCGTCCRPRSCRRDRPAAASK